MKRMIRIFSVLATIAFVMSVAIVGGVLQPGADFDPALIVMDDAAFTHESWGSAHPVAAMLAIFVVLMVALLLLPVVVLVPLLVLALPLAFAALTVAGVAALLLSPLLLVGWVIWRLVRSPRPPAHAATMAR